MSNVNDIISQINAQVSALSGSSTSTTTTYVASDPPPTTISTAGISPGGVITSQQILRIINALNGVDTNLIIISGSLSASGSNVLNGTLALPFIQDGNYLFVTGGLVTGTNTVTTASFATSASYATTSSLALLGVVTASALASTITFTRGDQTTFDVIIAQSGSVESASYALFAQTAGAASTATSSSYALTASFALNAGSPFSISTGSVVASVSTSPASIFLIQSASLPFFNIASNSNTTAYSDLFIIRGFTSQQPVLTVSGSIVNIATHSIDPTGNTVVGNIYFTSGAMYVGLE